MTYITIVGLRYYFGNEVFRVGQRLLIEKDIDNEMCIRDRYIQHPSYLSKPRYHSITISMKF